MSISEIVSMISSIAAVFAIIISLFNVRELVKQRKQTIVPELIFKEGKFSIFNGSNTPIPLR
ncbi:hypothetical protein [Paenibacillus sp. RC67]|uniref:hypothetical protein n=1 Tax=Paenibacillus sp. RC67 TaxID=3039392 RepID=UPI0024AD8548|nr:hypothetical protein [Paenibacillus sp. RC67]